MDLVPLILVKLLIFNYCLCDLGDCYDMSGVNEEVCITVPEKDDSDTIYLIEPSDERTDVTTAQELHKKLQEMVPCLKFVIIKNRCSGDVGSTIQLSEIVKNVINLHVTDFNKYNYDYITAKKLFYAGTMRKQNILNACTVKNSIGSSNSTSCANEYYTKLISASVVENEGLNRVVLILNDYSNKGMIQNESEIKEHICPVAIPETISVNILLCVQYALYNLRDNVNIDWGSLHLTVNTSYNCKAQMESLRGSLFAVLAPQPFLINYESKIPIIFYNQPYMTQEQNVMFPNSLVMMKNSELLPHGVIQLMRKMQWIRVAVLSDGSPYAEEFDDNLRRLFEKEQIAYIMEKSKTGDSNFVESLRYLHEVMAKIVILNIDAKNARYFYEAMKTTRKSKRIVWIVRDWPFADLKAHEYPFDGRSLVYTISMNNYERFEPASLVLLPSTELQHTRISESLSLVQDVLVDVKEKDTNFQLDYNTIHSKLNNAVGYPSVTKEAVAYVTLVERRGPMGEILKISISEDRAGRVKADTLQLADFRRLVLDRVSCVVNKNNYLDPCANQELLFLMLVLIGFSLTLLVITIFFNNVSSNSYTNL